MDAAMTAEPHPLSRRRALLVTAVAPMVPQILGSAFNIWYNAVVVDSLLPTATLKHRFAQTVIACNALLYPLAIGIWLWLVYSLRHDFNILLNGGTVPAERLDRDRRRIVNLPWTGSIVGGAAWIVCIPVFLISLSLVGEPLSPQLYWHLPISFVVSAFIAVTQGFFVVELASHWGLFPVFFRDARPDRIANIHPLSLRARGVMWAVSAGICPIGSLLLLNFAPAAPETNPQWFGLFVGTVGIAFGLCSAVLLGRLVATPVDELRTAAQAVTEGRFDVKVPLQRADEFGALIGDFNGMVTELADKERVRRTFGLHVGRRAADQILTSMPGVGGAEQNVTAMFADIRSFTANSETRQPAQVVGLLNQFLDAMVQVVEIEHSGMINKFLGDGFMAIFGVGSNQLDHADEALETAQAMLRRLVTLNQTLAAAGETPIAIGIGLNSGPAIVGSIGSPQRLEFTAIGNTINVASRIEGLTKTLKEPLLLTEWTMEALRNPIPLREFDPQEVRGVNKPVRVFTPAR